VGYPLCEQTLRPAHLTLDLWIDYVCHQADSEAKYKLYLNLLHGKTEEYEVLPENTYNIDEKGFMIGVTGRSKRIFSRANWEKKKKTKSNSRWIP
jgi:hypothetical protein